MSDTTLPISLPHDPRVDHRFALLNGINYHYLFAEPQGEVKATVFLIHGWPELSAAWRYQIPALLRIGCRVIVPDMMGFGRTEAPVSITKYTLKAAASDMAELARLLGVEKIFLGGHDWGGFVAYRMALWQPQLASHVFTVVTPYIPPSQTFLSLEQLSETSLPHLKYQIQFASGEIEEKIRTRDQIRQLLKAMYGGTDANGELAFDLKAGIQFEKLPKLKAPQLLTDKELEYYTDEYARNGLHGTLNWYRTRRLNHEDELSIDNARIEVPVLFIQSSKRSTAMDSALVGGTNTYLPKLTRRQIETGHWALIEAPEEINAYLTEWITQNMDPENQS